MSGNLRQRSDKKKTALDSLEREDVGPTERKIVTQDPSLLPTYVGVVIISLLLANFWEASHLNSSLPKQVTLAEELVQPTRFIGERAESTLRRLTDLGARVVGSYECEVLAPKLIKRELEIITATADPIHHILIDEQKCVGSFHLAFKPYGFQSVYENVQNIIVRIGPPFYAPNSILLNCHFDTVPESPGASDNGLNCAVMIEVLRKLSRQKFELTHNVIFLFNGAEENPLQGSHGFITRHVWGKEVRVVINLDSAGAGGRENLFQVTPGHSWLLELYANVVPYPSGSVMAEEIFQSGLIPSDTDFRIFRDFGNITGYDLAHCDNGYIYHTRLDQMSFIKRGVYQHTGDNILALVRALAYADELKDIELQFEGPSAIGPYYTDFFGKHFFVLSHLSATLISLITVIMSAYMAFRALKKVPDGVEWSLLATIVGWAASLSVALLISRVLDLTETVLSWYKQPLLIIPLYAVPCAMATLWPLILNQQLTPRKQVARAFHASVGHTLLMTILLLVGTMSSIRSSFMFVFYLFPCSVLGLIFLHSKWFSAKRFVWIQFIASFLPTTFISYSCLKLFLVLIPITGRSGPNIDVELYISVLTCFVCLISLGQMTAVLLTIKNPRVFLKIGLVIHGIVLLLLVTTPFGFPYSDDIFSPAPQRFYLFHTQRIYHNENGSVRKNDSGIFIVPLDRNGIKYVKSYNSLLNEAVINNDCESELVCGFPIYTSRYLALASSKWLPFVSPHITHPTSLKLIYQTEVDNTTQRFFFQLSGPDHMVLLVQMRENCIFSNWTLGINEPVPARFNNKNVYLVYFSDGHLDDIQRFSFDIKTEPVRKGPVMDINVIGHYIHHKANYHHKFNEFLALFPKWTQPISWVTTVNSWMF